MLDCSTNLGDILKTRFVFYLGDADVGMPSQLDTGQCNIALDSIGQRGKNDLPSKNTYTYNIIYVCDIYARSVCLLLFWEQISYFFLCLLRDSSTNRHLVYYMYLGSSF